MMADASYQIPWDGFKIMSRCFRADRDVARLGHNVRARLRSFIWCKTYANAWRDFFAPKESRFSLPETIEIWWDIFIGYIEMNTDYYIL